MNKPRIPEKLKILPLKQIKPPHEPCIRRLEEKLINSMKTDGWKGRPLLVVKVGKDKYRALTGSHRFASAKKAKMTHVPCMVITLKDPKVIFGDFDISGDYSDYRVIGRRLTRMGYYLAGILMSKDYHAYLY